MQVRKKILSLESLRGIAALTVTIYHFNIGSHFNNVFTSNAWLMVDFFFVLSGFVIALNYQSRINSFSSLCQFQYKRFLRLYPLHLVMLFVFLGLEFARYFAEVRFNMSGNSPAFSNNNLSSFASNVLLVQNWVLPELTWNAPSWSISAEFYTYALFAFLALATTGSKFRLTAFSFVLVISAGIVLFINGMGTDNISGPSRCIYSFFIGVLTLIAYTHFNLQDKIQSSIGAFTSILLSIYLVILLGSSEGPVTMCLPLVFAMTVLLLVSTKETTTLNTVLSNQRFVYLGTVSYGIYMVHAAIWWAFKQTLRFIFRLPIETDPEGKVSIVFENPFIADVVMLAGLSLIVICAHFSYLYIEQRFNIKRQKVAVS